MRCCNFFKRRDAGRTSGDEEVLVRDEDEGDMREKRVVRSASQFIRVAGLIAHCEGRELLIVPELIMFQQGYALQRLAQAMVFDISCHNAPVFVTYSTGHREWDAIGFGPGTCYAAAVLKAFFDVGIQCFSVLMIPAGTSPDVFLERFTTCKVLLVVQTKALYLEESCLRAIYEAQKNAVKIIPLAFERDLPGREQQWPSIKSTDMDGTLLLTEVQKDFCLLPTRPASPRTMLSDPDELDRLVDYVKTFLCDPHCVRRSEQASCHNTAHSMPAPCEDNFKLRNLIDETPTAKQTHSMPAPCEDDFKLRNLIDETPTAKQTKGKAKARKGKAKRSPGETKTPTEQIPENEDETPTKAHKGKEKRSPGKTKTKRSPGGNENIARSL